MGFCRGKGWGTESAATPLHMPPPRKSSVTHLPPHQVLWRSQGFVPPVIFLSHHGPHPRSPRGTGQGYQAPRKVCAASLFSAPAQIPWASPFLPITPSFCQPGTGPGVGTARAGDLQRQASSACSGLLYLRRAVPMSLPSDSCQIPPLGITGILNCSPAAQRSRHPWEGLPGEAVLVRNMAPPCEGNVHGVHLSVGPSQRARKHYASVLYHILDFENDFRVVPSSGFS